MLPGLIHSLSIPSKESLFDVVSYISILYFCTDYVLPKVGIILRRVADAVLAGVEYYYGFKQRMREIRHNFHGSLRPLGSAAVSSTEPQAAEATRNP